MKLLCILLLPLIAISFEKENKQDIFSAKFLLKREKVLDICPGSVYNVTVAKFMRTWRNWQTRTAKDRVVRALQVRVLLSAPSETSLSSERLVLFFIAKASY